MKKNYVLIINKLVEDEERNDFFGNFCHGKNGKVSE